MKWEESNNGFQSIEQPTVPNAAPVANLKASWRMMKVK